MRRALPLVFVLVASAPGVAAAADFAEDGSLVFDAEATAVLDFEEPVDADAGGVPPVADPGALSGSKVLTLGTFQGADIPLALPAEARTYRISAWTRGGESVVDIVLSYNEGRIDEFAGLYPTGRITSDGWVELANDHVRIDGTRLYGAAMGVFSPSGSSVDAIEIVPDGGLGELAAAPNAPCDGLAEASACGEQQVCMWSTCRNVNGWVPPIPADREAVTSYLENRLVLLFGPYRERTIDLPGAQIAIEQMRQADDPWGYWNGFMLAVRRLHDGHTSTSGLADFILENRKPLALCFLEGDADLTHAVAPKDPLYLDVLVSHTGGDHNLGLRAGDRLVRIDGLHPLAWARSLVTVNWAQPAISNHETFAELAARMRGLIPRYAHEIEVIRCDELGSCGAVETISITELPFDAPGTPFDGVACDNRPRRHLADSPPNHASAAGDSVYSGIVIESDAVEKIYGLEWESLYTTGNDGVGPKLEDAVELWKTAGARGVILDHRKGTGGTILAPEILWRFAVPRHASDFYVDRQLAEDEQPTLAEGLAIFEKAVADGTVQYAGSSTPVTDVPVALLLTEDVSASDWLPLGMKGAPLVKSFGPYQTNGAFSTLFGFGYWVGMGYSIAVGDTFLPDGSTHNGRGVEPDVTVRPKQSDLVLGKDTVYEAALAWVRQELAP